VIFIFLSVAQVQQEVDCWGPFDAHRMHRPSHALLCTSLLVPPHLAVLRYSHQHRSQQRSQPCFLHRAEPEILNFKEN